MVLQHALAARRPCKGLAAQARAQPVGAAGAQRGGTLAVWGRLARPPTLRARQIAAPPEDVEGRCVVTEAAIVHGAQGPCNVHAPDS